MNEMKEDMIDWLDWIDEWMDEWMDEWTSEWIEYTRNMRRLLRL